MNFEHLDKLALKRFRDRELDRAQAAATILHLSGCTECMEVYRNMFPEVVDIREKTGFPPEPYEVEAAFHLEYDEHLEPYVDGTIAEIDREIVEGHIKTCGHCASMLRDLQEFRDRIETDSIRMVPAETGIWERITTAVRSHFAVVAFATVLLLVIAGGVVIYNLTKRAEPEKTVVDDVQTPQIVGQASNSDQTLPSVANSEDRPPVDDKEPEVAALSIPSFLKDLRAERPGTLRGGGEVIEITEISPNGVVVRNIPLLRWRAPGGVANFEVAVFDQQDQRITGIAAVSRNSWRPAGLRRGQVYQWQVSAGSADDPERKFIGQGKFYLTSDKEEARITTAPGPLERGRALAEAGLLREAEAEFRQYLRTNPNSEAARKYLRQISSRQ